MDMKPYSGLIAGAVTSLVAVSPVHSVDIQAMNFDVRPERSGLQVTLAIAGENQDLPQVLTVSRNNETITDILNANIDLGDRQSFTQQNPMPGIKSLEIQQITPQNVRIIAVGETTAPTGEILKRDPQNLTLNFSTTHKAQNTQSAPTSTLIAQNNTPTTTTTTPTPATNTNIAEPAILFPDPQIPREGKPSTANTDNLLRPTAPIPPFLPRASAPPVGDISISTIDTTFPNYVDLGTAAVVPRLVLREAPTQDVLTLLARSADLNLVFADDITGKSISLDLENEPVQDVFNYVLMLSDLDATIRGRTIFVGTELPGSITPKITRTFRLNQAEAAEAKTYLESAGTDAEGLLPNIQILTDERLNSITVTGEPKVIEIASNFLTQLDARKRQVAVNVKIIDVTLTGSRSISSDIKLLLEDRVGISAGDGIILSPNDLARTSGLFSDFNPSGISVEQGDTTISLGEQFDAFDASDPTNTVFVGPIQEAINVAESIDPLFPGGTITIANPNQIVAVVQQEVTDSAGNITFKAKLEGLGNLKTSPTANTNFVGQLVAGLLRNTTSKIVADPTLIIQENETGNIDLTQDIVVGTIEKRQQNDQGVVTDRIVEPVIGQVGLKVQVEVDKIDDNGFVTINVQPEVSSIAGRETVNNAPVTLKRQSNLQSGLVRLRDDQTLILAGVIDEQDVVSTTKVPLLGDIPILGSLFRSSQRANTRRELLFIITPQIIDDSQNATWGYGYSPSETSKNLLEDERFPVQDRF